MRRDLGDRRRAVPGEPGRLLLARRDLAGQRDLERPLAQREPGQIVAGDTSGPRRSGRRAGRPPSPAPPAPRSSGHGHSRSSGCVRLKRHPDGGVRRAAPASGAPSRQLASKLSSRRPRWPRVSTEAGVLQRRCGELVPVRPRLCVRVHPAPISGSALVVAVLLEPEAGDDEFRTPQHREVIVLRRACGELDHRRRRLKTLSTAIQHEVVVRRDVGERDRQRRLPATCWAAACHSHQARPCICVWYRRKM